ncbi:hypothetical protein NAC44_09535 [Allorhizobium sp. BGMRC 0089]|nr:hypothetical protein [Allorhizobium sonneratiae]
MLNAEDAALLKCEEGSAFLSNRRLSHSADQRRSAMILRRSRSQIIVP